MSKIKNTLSGVACMFAIILCSACSSSLPKLASDVSYTAESDLYSDLISATLNNDVATVERILTTNKNLNLNLTSHSQPLLFVPLDNLKGKMVPLYINAGADVNQLMVNGEPVACRAQLSSSYAKDLLEAGAFPVTNKGKLCYAWSSLNYVEDDNTPLLLIKNIKSHADSFDVAPLLTQLLTKTIETLDDTRRYLHQAVMNKTNMVEYYQVKEQHLKKYITVLLEHGASPNAAFIKKDGRADSYYTSIESLTSGDKKYIDDILIDLTLNHNAKLHFNEKSTSHCDHFETLIKDSSAKLTQIIIEHNPQAFSYCSGKIFSDATQSKKLTNILGNSWLKHITIAPDTLNDIVKKGNQESFKRVSSQGLVKPTKELMLLAIKYSNHQAAQWLMKQPELTPDPEFMKSALIENNHQVYDYYHALGVTIDNIYIPKRKLIAITQKHHGEASLFSKALSHGNLLPSSLGYELAELITKWDSITWSATYAHQLKEETKQAVIALLAAGAPITQTRSVTHILNDNPYIKPENNVKKEKRTLLEIAVLHGDSDVVELLLAVGANPNQKTPLTQQYTKFTSLLAYADMNITPDSNARRNKTAAFEKVYTALLRYGAKPLDKAKENSNFDTFMKVAVTAATAATAYSSGIDAYHATDITSAMASDIWTDGKSNNMRNLYSSYLQGNYEIKNDSIRRLFEQHKENDRIIQQYQVEASKRKAAIEEAKKQRETIALQVKQQSILIANQAKPIAEQQPIEVPKDNKEKAPSPKKIRYINIHTGEERLVTQAELAEIKARDKAKNNPAVDKVANAKPVEGVENIGNAYFNPATVGKQKAKVDLKGTLSKNNLTVGGQVLKSCTVGYSISSFMGSPLVNGSLKWESESGEKEEMVLGYKVTIWLKVASEGSFGWLQLRPYIPKSGEGYGMNMPGASDWGDLISGFKGSTPEGFLTELQAKKIFSQMEVVDFKLSHH